MRLKTAMITAIYASMKAPTAVSTAAVSARIGTQVLGREWARRADRGRGTSMLMCTTMETPEITAVRATMIGGFVTSGRCAGGSGSHGLLGCLSI